MPQKPAPIRWTVVARTVVATGRDARTDQQIRVLLLLINLTNPKPKEGSA